MTRKDFASDEEWQVYSWLKEAEDYGLVRGIEYQPGPFELCTRSSVIVKTKSKEINKFLFHAHKYTPDFEFYIVSDALFGVFKYPKKVLCGTAVMPEVIIDVKGSFNKFGDPKQFAINQKWMWDKFHIYVEKIVPGKLFKKTWVPECCRLTPKQGKPVKKYAGFKTVIEFIESNKEF